MTTATKERTKPAADEAIDCDHRDGDASLIRAIADDFPGYWSCTRCGHPFVSGTIVAPATAVVTLYGEVQRGRAGLAPQLMEAVQRLERTIPPVVTAVPE